MPGHTAKKKAMTAKKNKPKKTKMTMKKATAKPKRGY